MMVAQSPTMAEHDVFISHAYKDGAVAEALRVECTAQHGLSCWMGSRDIAPGKSWPEVIAQAVPRSAVMVVLLSHSSVTSWHVRNEVALAARHDVPVLPVRIEDIQLEGELEYWLGSVNWIDAFGRTPASDRMIAEKVRQLVASRTLPTRPTQLEDQTIGRDVIANTPEDVTEAEKPPPRVSRANPACIVVLVDCSNSMNQRLGNTTFSRRVVVAQQINALLDDLVWQATKDPGVLPYYWVAVQGYGLGNGREVLSLLPDRGGSDDLVPIDELAPAFRRLETVQGTVKGPDGSTTIVAKEHPVWVEATAKVQGNTVARAAFQRAFELCDRWVAERPDAFPPLVLNITDGGYTDGDPSELVRAIEELATKLGNALVFNCHLSSSINQNPILFPTDEQASSFRKETRMLFDQSSPIPPSMLKVARAQGQALREGARGYVFNAEVTDLVDFFEVGTLPRRERR